MRVLPNAAQGIRCRLQEPRGGASVVRVHAAGQRPRRPQGAWRIRREQCSQRGVAGGRQVTGLLAAAYRAGRQRRAVAAAAPVASVVAADGKSCPPAAGALPVVGRVLAEAAGADGLPGRRPAGHRRALPAAAAHLELILVIAAPAAALLTVPVAQPHRPAAGRAGRCHDARGPGGEQRVDENVDPR